MQHTHWKIEQPCQVPLNKMDQVENGYFCHSCQKKVHDLSLVKTIPAENICGYTVEQKSLTISAAGKWPVFLLRWLGTFALLFIPMKKGKPAMPTGTMPDPAGENKKAFGPKRIMGTVLDAAKRPVRTVVRVCDDNGTVLAETNSMINGRYMVVVDTPAVDTPHITITAVDTTAYKITLDTFVVGTYPKDIMWLHNDVIVTAGVPPQMPDIVDIKIPQFIGSVYFDIGVTKTLESGAVAGAQNISQQS
jgi:hypothetical protein